MAWRLHIESTAAKLLGTLKNEVFSPDIKLTFYKALIRSIMVYAYPTWEYAADAYLLKRRGLQN
jgi:hypothetical protein